MEHSPIPSSRGAPGRLLKMADVVHETSLHRATIYRHIKSGDFPESVKLGARRVAWREADIEAWKALRPENSPENGA